ncbi:hypothetical protein EV426DRAFT_703179 [Tirmania nivea]|nr:hypothetical protein EV426DRAFT_703179 [Tirmania nivea]
MPPLSKKRKACIASTAKARKALRQQDSEEELELYHEGGLGGADSDVADSDVADSDVEEELVIEEDALARLMAIANSIDSDSEEPHFKYQRGVQQSRKTLYLARKKQADLQHAAANTAKITEFFTQPKEPKATVIPVTYCNQLQLAIDDLKALLRSKRAPIGQNLTRHNMSSTIREHIAAVGEKLTSHGLAKAVNEYLKEENIIAGAEDWERSMEISERTARIWLNKLGFRWKDVRKGVYVDGHERDDVVAYRQNIFLPQIDEIQSSGSLRQWDEDGNIIPVYLPLPLGEKEKILVTHDESTFNANDGKRQMWVKDDA